MKYSAVLYACAFRALRWGPPAGAEEVGDVDCEELVEDGMVKMASLAKRKEVVMGWTGVGRASLGALLAVGGAIGRVGGRGADNGGSRLSAPGTSEMWE